MRRFVKLLAGLAAVALLASYAGRLHPLGDSLAVFRPAFAVVLLIAAALLRGAAGALMLSVSLLALLPIAGQFRPGPDFSGRMFLYQKNMRFDNSDLDALYADITDFAPAIVTLEEVSEANLPLLDMLRPDLPHQLICPAHRVGAVAILSAYPMEATDCREGSGYASARVISPDGPVSVVALHLHWPWPHGQAAQVDALIPVLEALPRPVIVAGDFNMVPWADAPRRIAGATGTRFIRPMEITFMLRFYPLPIDHVLVPENVAAGQQRRGLDGSDHHGLVARIGPLSGG